MLGVGWNLDPIPRAKNELIPRDVEEQLAGGDDAHLTEGMTMLEDTPFRVVRLLKGLQAFILKNHVNLFTSWSEWCLPSSHEHEALSQIRTLSCKARRGLFPLETRSQIPCGLGGGAR